jgi:ectoine hydroxylase-related dioxygenase (phytanoyl-CoA dioxygenase family)
MANIVPAGRNANGSGGSWHRDSNFPQYKALVYVSDVNSVEDGAFQYIPKSNRMKYILREIHESKRTISDTRWTNDDLLTFQKGIPISVTGKAGTLVLFDTSLLHRGSPNSNSFSSPRVAITNYYYPIIGSIGDSYAK